MHFVALILNVSQNTRYFIIFNVGKSLFFIDADSVKNRAVPIDNPIQLVWHKMNLNLCIGMNEKKPHSGLSS